MYTEFRQDKIKGLERRMQFIMATTYLTLTTEDKNQIRHMLRESTCATYGDFMKKLEATNTIKRWNELELCYIYYLFVTDEELRERSSNKHFYFF